VNKSWHKDHRLRGSASPVLTATHHSYWSLAWLSDFFPAHPWRSAPPTDLHAKWLKRRGFTQGWYFCSKNRYFSISYPLSSRASKRSKFCKFLDLENFRSIWPLTLEVQRENTRYSSSEPNESGIVNRQSGGKKLTYMYLNFTWGYTSRDIVHAQWRFSIVSMSTWCLGRNISETVRDRDLGPKERTTNRKWPIPFPSPMVTWPMTPRDSDRSRSWPQYVWCPLSWKRLEIEALFQWIANR